ncbi:MAG: hypothetical protein B7Y80_01545 [Hyphomicrobium sp. 32-62-53]|nr:MAG: hypothetical protein B7Z29_01895 [Hyphomicrobium sp. 12-62-95]OYY01438.1 MAG: hypothetical protein B7Y80_01545 [Hyphomicrobium sp. 32-62-53]
MAPRKAARVREKKRTKKTASKPAPAEAATGVSAAELGAILASPPLGDRWLRELADRGFLVKVGRARYDLAKSVQGYLRFVRETEVTAAVTAATSREAFEAERARKLKLENDQRQAMLVETPDALAAIDHIFGQVRTALAGLPPRISEDVAERRRIENAIDATLADLAGRLDEASAALREGRDPLAASGENDAG